MFPPSVYYVAVYLTKVTYERLLCGNRISTVGLERDG